MQDNSLFAWLLLSQLPTFNAHNWSQLFVQHKLDAKQFVSLKNNDWLALGIPQTIINRRASATRSAQKALTFLQANLDVHVIKLADDLYPPHLKQLTHPPLVLFVRGQLNNLNETQLAIVGSRYASVNGKQVTESFACELAGHGIVITSGLARGIDASAHRGALQHNDGRTLAVLGCGIDICYPQYNQELCRSIVDNQGTVITEFLPGTPPRPYHFPRRNRIVAALTEGVLLVEAKIRSGSLITCNLAADLGKDVFAIPGNINNPLSEGGNWLIQQGAKLVTSTADILEELNIQPQIEDSQKSEKKHLASDPILDSVDYDVTQLSDITKRSKLSSKDVLTALLEYELRGLIASVPGGYLKLRGK